MKIFGDFQNRAIHFKSSRREQSVANSEDWSAAVMTGSSERVTGQELLPWPFFVLFGIAALVVTLLLFGRLANLQIINGQRQTALAAGNRVRSQTIPAPRGTIYDRKGQVLARNVAQYDLVVMPTQMPSSAADRQAKYDQLAQLTHAPTSDIKSKAEAKGLQYPQPLVVAENVDRDTALNLSEHQADLPGFSVDINPTREYLDGGTLSHFLGYIGRISAEEWAAHPNYRQIDYIGKSGLEQSYEADLKGVDGKEQTEVDVSGKPIKYLAKIDPAPGNSLMLSVDEGLQNKAAAALKAGIDKAGAKAGAVIAINPKNGQVLAAVNYPSYDGNLFTHGISSADYKRLTDDAANPLFNRITSGEYPIGSTSKPFVSVAGLQEGAINSSTTVNDTGHLDVPNQYNPSIVYVFKGWKPEGLGVVNVVRAITWSSDIFFYVTGGGYKDIKGLGVTKLTDWYKKFGFGQKTGIDLANESSGLVPGPETKQKVTKDPWAVGDTYNISIGQGDFRATPLQLAVATSTIANGGTLMKPHLVSEVRDPSGHTVRAIQPEVVRKDFISASNLSLVQSGMTEVVKSGTACCTMQREVPVQVAGKTGTAETSSQGFDGKNPTTKPHAWFSSYAPAGDPQIAMVVLVENSGEGADVAVPITTDILKWYFSPH